MSQTINTPRETTHQRIADALEDIVDKMVDTSSASNIDYDNTQSGLSANKVQGAVDELASEKADKSTTLAGYGITDAYTKAEVYTQSEVNNIVSTLETNIDWKEAVNTYADIATTYPNPQDGWTVNVKDTDYTYRYNGSEWVAISANAIPEATTSVKGLMTPTQVSKLNGIEAGAQVNTVTSVAGKTGAVTLTKSDVGLGNVDNTSDLDKPISTAVQTALNDKVDKVQGKGLSTNDYTNEEKQKNADNASAISDIQEDISQSLTATGNPLTIEASESNLVECVAEVEAEQDLHGYDHPWVGGAGKNKLLVNESTISQANYIFNTNIDLPAGTYTFSFESDVTTNLSIAVQNAGGTSMVNTSINYPARTCTFEISEAGKNVRLYGYAGTYTKMQIESGSVATSYEPYSNICPIEGRTGAKVRDVGGENKFTDVWTQDKSFNTSGELIAGSDRCATINGNRIKGGTTYKFLYDSSVQFGTFFYDANDSFIELHSWEDSGYTFTTPSNAAIVRFNYKSSTAPTNTQLLEVHTATITFGETVYGGTVNFNTGEVVVDTAIDEFDGSSDESWAIWQSGGHSFYGYTASDHIRPAVGTILESTKTNYLKLDTPAHTYASYEAYTMSTDVDSKRFSIVLSEEITSVSLCRSYLSNNPLQVCYKLATPYTIQLTPQQIKLLKGTNNISCNTGDLSIKYYPDNVLGQLKGDIEDEIDAVANRIKGVKTMQISGAAVSTDGSIMFTNLIGSIIVGTSISNDANSDKCVGIPYSMGTVPALKIMNESTMAVLPNITISGILYYIEL